MTISAPQGSIPATNQWGAIRALESFSQLVLWTPPLTRGSVSNNTYIIAGSPVTITDSPRFQWRGLLIDTSRHYLTVSAILTTLDAMSYNKLNVLHWHIIDDNSWPLVSEVYPLFSENGAYDSWSVYTMDDVQTIVGHAHDLGILVIPEFDMPAHADIWGAGYADTVVSCTQGQTLLDPTGPMYPYLNGLQNEFSSVFTDGFWHLGGDEVENYLCWDQSMEVQAFKTKMGFTTDQQLRNYFETTIQQIAVTNGYSPIFWEEVFDGGYTLDKTAVVNVWLSSAKTIQVLQAGLRAVHSYGWYLDEQNPPGASHYFWEDTWMNFYTNDPLGGQTVPPSQLALLLGGEASQWGEQVDSTNIFSRVWPRACATAERLWSALSVNDTNAAQARIERQRCNMVQRGIGAGPTRPGDEYVNCIIPETSSFNTYRRWPRKTKSQK